MGARACSPRTVASWACGRRTRPYDDLLTTYVDENATRGARGEPVDRTIASTWQTCSDDARGPRPTSTELGDDGAAGLRLGAGRARSPELTAGSLAPLSGSELSRRPIAASRRLRAPSSHSWHSRGERLAALPQRERLLERGATGLEGADHLDELLAGGLVGGSRRRGASGCRARRSGRVSMPVVVAWIRPSATRTLIAAPGARPGDGRDDVAVGVLQHGVARAAGSPAATGRGRGRAGGRCRRRPGRGGGASVRRARPAARRPRRTRGQQVARVGERRPRPERRRATPARAPAPRDDLRNRSRADRTPALLLGHVGHDQLGGVGRGGGADVGDQVEQGRVGLVADRRDHRAYACRCTARTSASSEKGSRSSTEPPPRATTMTSTSGVALEPRRAPPSPRRRTACPASRRRRTSKCDRGPAAARVLQDVALGGRLWARSPGRSGRAGTAASRLSSGANRPSAASS